MRSRVPNLNAEGRPSVAVGPEPPDPIQPVRRLRYGRGGTVQEQIPENLEREERVLPLIPPAVAESLP